MGKENDNHKWYSLIELSQNFFELIVSSETNQINAYTVHKSEDQKKKDKFITFFLSTYTIDNPKKTGRQIILNVIINYTPIFLNTNLNSIKTTLFDCYN
ncbi:hypothetical protein [Aquimarina algiphila]|uniref:hypothetical protein n=1 Tax=Aquimarina algiphila TaxID=2047982 RepID=UPI002490C819|nr:hypothetical protein [Aquimarina algiphila]